MKGNFPTTTNDPQPPLSSSTPKRPGRTTLLHFDHMNDHRGYTKLLTKWTKQLKLGGVLFLSLHCKPRPRHIFALLDSPQVLGGTGEFLTRLRTQNVDVNSRGQPCKERMSTVVAEFPLLLPKGHSKDESSTSLEAFCVVSAEGSNGSQTHMPFVREWLRNEYSASDAETIIAAMDGFLDATNTKPNKRR